MQPWPFAKLSIILVTRNHWGATAQCLLSLADALPDLPVEIIAVDNGSTDGTPENFTQIEDVHAILHDDNMGLAAAWNEGAHQATGDVLLFSHNDVFYTKNSLRRMLDALADAPDAGAIGAFTNRSRHCLATVPAYTSEEELQDVAALLEREQPLRRERMVLDGHALLVPRTAFERVGGFDEAYRLPGLEAVDFSFRLHTHGYHLYCAGTYMHHNEDSFAVNHVNAAQTLADQEPHFRDVWETGSTYSVNLRLDLLSMMDMERPGLRVLDASCACGTNLMRIREANPSAKLYGIELNEKTAAIARCFGEISNEDVEQLDRPDWDGTFDYVIAGDIIEHLRDPWAAVRHFARLLKPGGAILASVPNILFCEQIYDLMQGRWDYADAGILDRTHLRFFTKQTTRELFEGSGLVVRDMRSNCSLVEPERLQGLARDLMALPWAHVTEDELLAVQWLVDARRPEDDVQDATDEKAGRA